MSRLLLDTHALLWFVANDTGQFRGLWDDDCVVTYVGAGE